MVLGQIYFSLEKKNQIKPINSILFNLVNILFKIQILLIIINLYIIIIVKIDIKY